MQYDELVRQIAMSGNSFSESIAGSMHRSVVPGGNSNILLFITDDIDEKTPLPVDISILSKESYDERIEEGEEPKNILHEQQEIVHKVIAKTEGKLSGRQPVIP